MNKEIIEMLIIHQKRFPLMQPQDVVKLLYQNEFGGGHLISDANRSLMYLTKEYDSIQLFEEGMELSKKCSAFLSQAEKRITILVNNDDKVEEKNFIVE